mmetsp:Transcript_17198/g.41908  ORF Transcript_17198/g.41908 Transcript_17198/m.41908 type:complete len:81 (+) Transcript_17198:178-420(+)
MRRLRVANDGILILCQQQVMLKQKVNESRHEREFDIHSQYRCFIPNEVLRLSLTGLVTICQCWMRSADYLQLKQKRQSTH